MLKSGSTLRVANNSQLIIEEGANFIFENGASIELLGNNATLVIKGKVTVGDNATLTFTGTGRMVIDQFIFDGVYDNFWDIGQNARLELNGSLLRTLLECKGNIVPKMQNQHTFSEIKIHNGIVAMHPNTQISTHAPLDLLKVNFKRAGTSGLHNGLHIWGQASTIKECTFMHGTTGLRSEQALATNALNLQGCSFYENVIGLYTRGKNAVVNGCVFQNNTNGGWDAYQMSGTSSLSNSTFNNPNAIGAVSFEGQQGATLLANGNMFTNSATGMFVETATLIPTCNTFSNATFEGIFALESNLYLNEDKFNLFNNNSSGITIYNGDGDAFFMENGQNQFQLGNAGFNHINGGFFAGAILNMPTATTIDAENNSMQTVTIGGNTGVPVDIDFYPNGASPYALSLHIPNNQGANSSNCSISAGGVGILEEAVTLAQLTSLKTINTSLYPGINLQAALLDAVSYVSTDMQEANDLMAIERLYQILTYNIGSPTVDEEAMLEIGYKVLIKSLNFAFAYGSLQLNRAEPYPHDAYTDMVLAVINYRLNGLNSASITYQAELFRLNLDIAHTYRLGEYYDQAIAHLQGTQSWAN